MNKVQDLSLSHWSRRIIHPISTPLHKHSLALSQPNSSSLCLTFAFASAGPPGTTLPAPLYLSLQIGLLKASLLLISRAEAAMPSLKPLERVTLISPRGPCSSDFAMLVFISKFALPPKAVGDVERGSFLYRLSSLPLDLAGSES